MLQTPGAFIKVAVAIIVTFDAGNEVFQRHFGMPWRNAGPAHEAARCAPQVMNHPPWQLGLFVGLAQFCQHHLVEGGLEFGIPADSALVIVREYPSWLAVNLGDGVRQRPCSVAAQSLCWIYRVRFA